MAHAQHLPQHTGSFALWLELDEDVKRAKSLTNQILDALENPANRNKSATEVGERLITKFKNDPNFLAKPNKDELRKVYAKIRSLSKKMDETTEKLLQETQKEYDEAIARLAATKVKLQAEINTEETKKASNNLEEVKKAESRITLLKKRVGEIDKKTTALKGGKQTLDQDTQSKNPIKRTEAITVASQVLRQNKLPGGTSVSQPIPIDTIDQLIEMYEKTRDDFPQASALKNLKTEIVKFNEGNAELNELADKGIKDAADEKKYREALKKTNAAHVAIADFDDETKVQIYNAFEKQQKGKVLENITGQMNAIAKDITPQMMDRYLGSTGSDDMQPLQAKSTLDFNISNHVDITKDQNRIITKATSTDHEKRWDGGYKFKETKHPELVGMKVGELNEYRKAWNAQHKDNPDAQIPVPKKAGVFSDKTRFKCGKHKNEFLKFAKDEHEKKLERIKKAQAKTVLPQAQPAAGNTVLPQQNQQGAGQQPQPGAAQQPQPAVAQQSVQAIPVVQGQPIAPVADGKNPITVDAIPVAPPVVNAIPIPGK